MCRITVIARLTTDQRRGVFSASSVSGCVSLQPRTLCPLLVNIIWSWSQHNNSHLPDPTLLTCERNSPVISLPVPGDLQYRLQYTTVNNRGQCQYHSLLSISSYCHPNLLIPGRRQIEDTGLTNHRFPNQCGNGHSQNRNRNVKMWTPLGRASVKISCITQRI